MLNSKEKNFTFIDLFAGIGGIRLGFQLNGGRCVFSSEWDKYSQATYEAFYGEKPHGDITKINPKEIPNHDILTAGFPCQPFSLAGVSKKKSLGRAHGFDDPTQGTLFFNVKEIIKSKKPKAFLLENVKNLTSHDSGKTFSVITETLKGLGYNIHFKVIDSSHWVPQHRERIYIVGFRKDLKVANFKFPDLPPKKIYTLDEILLPKVESRYTLGEGTWSTLVRHKAHHEKKGQGFGYGLISPPFKDKVTRTISARYHKDGAEVLIAQGKNQRPRRLTPLECFRLQGFPKTLEIFYNGSSPQPVSDTQAYRQFGNSVSVPVIRAIAKQMVDALEFNVKPLKLKKARNELAQAQL